MNLKTLEVVSLLRYRLLQYEAHVNHLSEVERAKVPEIVEGILEAAQELDRLTKGVTQ